MHYKNCRFSKPGDKTKVNREFKPSTKKKHKKLLDLYNLDPQSNKIQHYFVLKYYIE